VPYARWIVKLPQQHFKDCTAKTQLIDWLSSV